MTRMMSCATAIRFRDEAAVLFAASYLPRSCSRSRAARIPPRCCGSRRAGATALESRPEADRRHGRSRPAQGVGARGARGEAARRRRSRSSTARCAGPARKPKTGIQEAARNARYRLLAEAARKARRAAHPHRAYARRPGRDGAVPAGARQRAERACAGWRQRRAGSGARRRRPSMLVRPLLAIPKARLHRDPQGAANIAFADDPSNRDPRFTRPRLRALMPRSRAEGLDARTARQPRAAGGTRRGRADRARGRRGGSSPCRPGAFGRRPGRSVRRGILRAACRDRRCGCSAGRSRGSATKARSSLASSRAL